MKVYLTQIRMALRLTFRNRAALVFGYGFPLLFFFIFGSFMGRGGGGAGASQVVAMVLSIGVLGAGFFGASLQAVMNREQNILRRFKVAPISPGPILVAAMVGGLLNYMPMALLILFLANRIHGMPWPPELLGLLVFIALGVVTFVSLGNVIAAVVNSMQEAQIVTQLFYMPMLLLGGATIPLSILPVWVQTLAQFLPSAYFMSGLQNLVRGRETLADNLSSVGALLLATAFGLLLAMKLFRWEKDEKMRPEAKLWLVAAFAPFLVMGAWQMHAKTNIERARLLERDIARGQTHLIRDARIFVGDGQVIDRGSVLIANGKIARVFTGDAPDPKSMNTNTIEAAGKTLLPGLIDTNVHLSSSGLLVGDAAIDRELAAYLYSGVTAVRSMGDDPAALAKDRDAIASGSKLGAELFMGSDGNVRGQKGGLASWEAMDANLRKSDEPLNRSLVRQVIPAQTLDEAKAALLTIGVFNNGFGSLVLGLEAEKKSLVTAYRADSTIAMGSGSGGPLLVHGPGIHRELQLWVDAGISPAEALQAATYNGARLLKVEDRIGRVQEGREANLLLIDGNPLKQISATEHISTVFFRGERVNRQGLFDQK